MSIPALLIKNHSLGQGAFSYANLIKAKARQELCPGLHFLSLIKDKEGLIKGVRLLSCEGEISHAAYKAKKAAKSEVALYFGGEYTFTYRVRDEEDNIVEEKVITVAATELEGPIHFEEGKDGEIYVKGIVSGEEEVFIPAEYNGKPVYGICPYAFHDQDKLKVVSLPLTLRNIMASAFVNCPILTDVDIPEEILYIEDYAFVNCPQVVPPKLSRQKGVGKNAFDGCLGKERNIFAHCGEAVEFSKVKHLKNFAPEELVVPEKINSIGNFSFFGFNDIHTLTFEGPLSFIGHSAFFNCRKLETINFSYGIQSIGPCCFSNTGIVELNYPGNISEISFGCFEDCSRLKKVKINEGVKKIGKRAFADCNKLESISLPSTLETIEEGAFQGCNGLKTIFYQGKLQKFGKLRVGIDKKAFHGVGDADILCSDGPTKLRK